jgi:ubiquitin
MKDPKILLKIVRRTYNKYTKYTKNTTQNNTNKIFQCIKENQV